jgi:3-hydroxybutyryl-CoA dehydrogenase
MKIAIIGAGTMGQGIAQLCAQNGLETVLFDINAAAAEQAHRATRQTWTTLNQRGKITPEARDQAEAHLSVTTRFEDLVADVLLEAVVERLDVKQQLFGALAQQNAPEAVLAPIRRRSRLRASRPACPTRRGWSGCTSSTPPR